MRRLRRLARVGRILVALAGVGFAYAAYVYLTLPDVRPLRTSPPGTTAFMELRASEARSRGDEPRRVQRWVPYSRISPQLVRAVLVTEDAKFWQHAGVDYEQIKESMEVNLERGEFARGASTITQQLAKNLYLSPSKNPVRKIRELMIARRLEHELPKRRILEIYLNVIEWGPNVWGVEAAARYHYKTSAAALNREQAARLAACIPSPRRRRPAQMNQYSGIILERMSSRGW